MKLYYANYPSLERHFVRWIAQERTRTLDKWLVIGASSLINRRLQTVLARTYGALANIHFTTLSGLISTLDQEHPGPTLPLLPQDHLRDFLIKELLLTPGLNRYPISRGFVQSVKAALRDLQDSLADPNILEEHWQSMPEKVQQQDGGRFPWLVRLYRQYREKEKKVPGYRTYQQAFERALLQAEKSSYLQSFSHLVLYGFYDMPGRQLELINLLKMHYPLTVFAPYEKHPAYQFAQTFFETHFLSVPGATALTDPSPCALGNSRPYVFDVTGSADAPGVHFISAPDAQREVFFAAKEMLRLHQEKGLSFGDMALVARNLAPYQDTIRRVLRANYIPVDGAFTYPLSHYALGAFCLTLLTLAQQGFARAQVLSVFASPYFKNERKQLWQKSLRRCPVNRDVSQWQDLLADTTGPQQEILNWVVQTARQLDAFAQPLAWSEGVVQVLAFLDKWVDTASFEGKDTEIFQTIRQTISQMAAYEGLRPVSKPGELVRELTDALTALTFNEAENLPGGVTVTDAIRVRGLQFKIVFVLGVNEGEFPPIVSEDPILRDFYRHFLRDTLGYWINASLDRIDEERLLFYTLLTAAQEHIYILSARYGPDGKTTLPSAYLAELARACNQSAEPEKMTWISGQLSSQLAHCSPLLLTPGEVSFSLVLHASNVQEQFAQAGLLTEAKTNALHAAQAISARGDLGPYDGILKNGEQIFTQKNKKGFSASALQEIAACPFKYFMHRVLHVEQPDEPLNRQELAANEKGSSSHALLHDLYNTLHQHNLTRQLVAAGVENYLVEVFEKHYPAKAYRIYGIYPVVWELFTEQLRRTLTEFVLEDMAQLENFTPAFFEQEVTAGPTHELPFHLYGFIDRIDIDEQHNLARIIDYKSTPKGTKHLEKDFFTLHTFQPFLYMWMARQSARLAPYALQEACLLTLEHFHKQTLPTAEFEAIRPAACQFLRALVNLVRQGTFFINPSGSCKYCPYALLCRKDAFRPLLRARNSTLSALLQEKQK